jgi:hypothetical protein
VCKRGASTLLQLNWYICNFSLPYQKQVHFDIP